MIGGLALLLVALLASVTPAAGWNLGAGTLYRLNVTQDVALERGYRNFNYLQYLIVSRLPQFPNTRSLVQFKDLPSTQALYLRSNPPRCTCTMCTPARRAGIPSTELPLFLAICRCALQLLII